SAAAPGPARPRSGQRGGTGGDERRAPGARRSSTQSQRGSQTEVHLLVLRLAGVELTQLVLQVVAQTVAVVPLEGPQPLDRLVEVGLLFLEGGPGGPGLLLVLAGVAAVLLVRLGDDPVALILTLLHVLVVQTVGQDDDAGRVLRRIGGGLLGSGLLVDRLLGDGVLHDLLRGGGIGVLGRDRGLLDDVVVLHRGSGGRGGGL